MLQYTVWHIALFYNEATVLQGQYEKETEREEPRETILNDNITIV